MRPVVFINVDGVLHPTATQYAIALGSYRDLELPKPFCWANSLQSLAERLDLAFVFHGSSTQLLGLDGIKALAPVWLRERVIGATDPTTQWLTPFDALEVATTFAVIQRFVLQHGLGVWAAMDDVDDGWPEDRESREHLIKCDPRQGVRDLKVQRQLAAALERMQGDISV